MTMQEKSNTWIWVVIIVAIVALMIAGVALYDYGKDTREAHAKAQELIAELTAAGFKAPKEDVLVELFGTDGGAAAEHPGAALLKWEYAARLGTSGPASRAVILDPSFVEAEKIFLSVYAPDKLAQFQEFIDSMEFGDTQ